MHNCRILVFLLFTIVLFTRLDAAIWQYSVKVGDSNSVAYMYIPPTCKEARIALIALDNLLELPLLEEDIIRKLAAEENMVLIWICADENGKRVFDKGIDYSAGDDRLFERMMADLSIESGYSEIKDIPFISLGHSAGVHFACGLGYYKPERTAGIIALKTNIPSPPKDAPNQNLYGIPFLIVKGQYGEWLGTENVNQEGSWNGQRKFALKLRSENENNLISYLLDVGDGHFSGHPELYEALALYIHKVITYRLPDKKGRSSHVLKMLSGNEGYLTDSGVSIEETSMQIASFADFKGDKSQTFWYLDEELAIYFRRYGQQYKNKKRQYMTFSDNGTAMKWGRRGPVDMQCKPQEDGRTFTLYATFQDTVPARLINGDIPVSHAATPAKVKLIRGPVTQIDENTFRITFNRSGFSWRGCDTWFLAYHPGDEQYAKSVFPGEIAFNSINKVGKAQTITFAPIADQSSSIKELELTATVDSHLPVEYYVQSGPAKIEGNKLIFTELPPRTAYPVKVVLTAYQWGRSVEPYYQSAIPVTRIFYIHK